MSAELTALMTTFNSASYITEAIDSILAQSFTDFELLILDDGSSDETVELIKVFDDPRIRLIENQENKGVGFRLNQALRYINSPYIVKTDADDINLPERFEAQLSHLKLSGADINKCYIEYFADSPSVANSERFINFVQTKQPLLNSIDSSNKIHCELPRWLCFLHASYMAKTEAIKQAGYPAKRMFEDYGMFYRLLEKGYIFDCVASVLVKIRVSDTSITATASTGDLDEGMNTLVSIKWPYIAKLAQNGPLFIYGSGGGARSLKRVLEQRNMHIQGFIEKDKMPDAEVVEGLPVVTLDETLYDCPAAKVIVAAQPVRAEVCAVLNHNAMLEWQDYIVIN
ncbi:glycosyltransferase [Salinimonas marina]|uniref:Glycosyltransferase n=1 Tax=Salinimonas marina TaxID=2785918 RepID=A0A7S9DW30_9ALTE|nr:glycosyltransferase [Salinimonas marina]QPG04958.1 glycosyltransferase [Salinimonas marina]